MLRFVIFAFWIMLISINSSFSFAQVEKASPPLTKVTSPGYPVKLDNQILFYIKEEVMGYDPEKRAETISEGIKKIADNPDIPINELTTSDYKIPMTLVTVGDHLLFSISDQDAQAEGRSREQLAKEYAEKLRTAVEQYREDRSLKNNLYGALYTLLLTIALIAVLILLKKLKQKFDQRIVSLIAARARGVQIHSFEIIRRDQLQSLLVGAGRSIRFLLLLLAFYLYVHFVLSFFPLTRPYAERILNYVLIPLTAIQNAIVASIPNLVYLVIFVLMALYILKIMKFFFFSVEKGTIKLSGFYPEWSKLTYKLLSWLVIAFFAIVAFPYIPGHESPAFKGVSIFLGVLFSLGSQSAVSNTIAGFALTYRRVFKVGDRVKIAEFIGDVVEKRLQVTTLRTVKNEEIVVPNSMILNSQVINYNTQAEGRGLILYTTVSIGYDAPWRRVHALLLKAAERTEGVLSYPAPFILHKSLDNFFVTYELNVYTDKPQRMVKTYSLLHQNIQDAFNEDGLELMSPHYTQLRDGNKVTIPESYLPKEYIPGALRILQTGNRGGNQEQKGGAGEHSPPESDLLRTTEKE